MSDDENNDADWGDALEEQAAGEADAGADADAGGDADWGDALNEQANAEAASFDALSNTSVASSNSELNLDVILDVPVTISMEVGNTKISIRNLLQLNQGSVIELDRLAGEKWSSLTISSVCV